MATLYENLQGGTITDNPLSSGATTINSSAFQYLPTLTGGDVMYITLDPAGVNGAPEIVKITAHSAAATSVTVVRAQQDTTARAHPVSSQWIHGLTEADVDEFLKSVATANIVDAAVTASKLASDSVTTAKIVDANVTAAKLASDSVTTAKILNANVTTAKLDDAAVTEAKIATGAVTNTKFGTGAVSTDKIAADAVTGAKIADDTIDSEHYVAGSIDAEHLAADSVTTVKILDANVTTDKLTSGSVTTAKLANNAVTTAKLDTGISGQLSGLPSVIQFGQISPTADGSGNAVYTFPTAFSGTPTVVATARSTTNGVVSIMGISSTQVTFRMSINDSTVTSAQIFLNYVAML